VTVAVTFGVDANAVAKVTAIKNEVPSVVAVPYCIVLMIGPVGPVSPVGPVGPVEPVGPVGPVAPLVKAVFGKTIFEAIPLTRVVNVALPDADANQLIPSVL
jgi:hypothetical protein